MNRVECWSANKVGFGKREEGEYRRIQHTGYMLVRRRREMKEMRGERDVVIPVVLNMLGTALRLLVLRPPALRCVACHALRRVRCEETWNSCLITLASLLVLL